MTFRFFLFTFLLGFFNVLRASEKEHIQVGLYIEMVHGIDYVKSQYEVVFYLWINSKERVYRFQDEIDIANSIDSEFSNEYIDSSLNGDYHYECKVRAKILNHFDIRNYPFDKQSLDLKLEFGNYSVNELSIELDRKHSKINPERTEGWNSKLKHFNVGFINYGSDFGDLYSDESIDYPSIDVKLDLYRDSWNLYFKSFLTLFLSFILVSVSMLYPNDHSEEKIGLIVGSLFTTVGNKYVTDDILPIQNVLNLSDKLHLLTIFIITLIATYTILEQRFKLKDSVRNDIIALSFFTILFFGGIMFFTVGAMQ